MSLHLFGNIVTHHGTAANNRGENEGNLTTLQKLIWHGQVHSTVSAEAIRFALRRRMLEDRQNLNRVWDEDARCNRWQDPTFASFADYMDSDLLGFMSADAAKEETDPGEGNGEGGEGKKKKAKGTATVRRSVLEVTRAVSLLPWFGDVAFGAASPGATPSAAKKGVNPVPYSGELHATRYQYGFALTPERLHDASRALLALRYLASLGPVAGNHARFFYDFSPESLVLRITQDPSPRILYCFELEDGQPRLATLLARVRSGDVLPSEIYVGGAVATTQEAKELAGLGCCVEPGVKGTVERAVAQAPQSPK